MLKVSMQQTPGLLVQKMLSLLLTWCILPSFIGASFTGRFDKNNFFSSEYLAEFHSVLKVLKNKRGKCSIFRII